METKVFDCCVCLNEYDRTDRIPKVIIPCGHTICSHCLNIILSKGSSPKCPLDRKVMTFQNIKDFPTNLDLLELLEEKQNDAKRCPIHKEPNEWVCMDDNCTVCGYCIHHGDHKGHVAVLVQEIQERVNIKKKIYQDALENLDKIGVHSILLETVKKRFSEFKEMLVKQEQEAQKEVEVLFNLKRFQIDITELKLLTESEGSEPNLSHEEAERLCKHVVKDFADIDILLESQREGLYDQMSSLR